MSDARGTVSFEGLPVGDYVLNLSLTGLSGEFRARDAHCGFDDDNGWNGTSSSTTNQIDVTISEPGRDLRCDWMITPLNDPPYWIPTPTEPAPANPTRPDQPVTALPNTGAGPSDPATDRARLPLLALGLAALAAPAVAPKLAARRA